MNRCDDCGHQCSDDELKVTLYQIPHLLERIEPGGIVPAGECPNCGALTYPDYSLQTNGQQD